MLYELTIGKCKNAQSLGVFKTRTDAFKALGEYVFANDPAEHLYPRIAEVESEICCFTRCSEKATCLVYNLETPHLQFPHCTAHYLYSVQCASEWGVNLGTKQLPPI